MLQKVIQDGQEKKERVNCKLHLNAIVLEIPMKSGFLAFQDVDISSFLEMCNDIFNLALAKICVHCNFFSKHCHVEMDSDPLNHFGDGFFLRHGNGKR